MFKIKFPKKKKKKKNQWASMSTSDQGGVRVLKIVGIMYKNGNLHSL